jgi:hypothetical protein
MLAELCLLLKTMAVLPRLSDALRIAIQSNLIALVPEFASKSIGLGPEGIVAFQLRHRRTGDVASAARILLRLISDCGKLSSPPFM